MTDTMTPPPEEKPVYSSDEQGLREAAQDHFGSTEPEVVLVCRVINEGPPEASDGLVEAQLDRMVRSGEITEAERGDVNVIVRQVIGP